MTDIDQIWQVKVTPKASRNLVELGGGTHSLRVYVTKVPENDKANEAVIALLAKYFKVAKSSIIIIKGRAGRNKLIKIKTD